MPEAAFVSIATLRLCDLVRAHEGGAVLLQGQRPEDGKGEAKRGSKCVFIAVMDGGSAHGIPMGFGLLPMVFRAFPCRRPTGNRGRELFDEEPRQLIGDLIGGGRV